MGNASAAGKIELYYSGSLSGNGASIQNPRAYY
jgi:hypothetical protein